MATIKSILALEDKMSPALSRAEKQAMANVRTYEKLVKEVDDLQKQMDKLSEVGLGQSALFNQLSVASDSLMTKMNGLEDGTMQAGEAAEEATSKFDGLFAKIASAAALIMGGKYLMNLSDTYTQTHARLGLITDDVDALESKIYKTAQSSRVAYQSVADTVAKLGMQAGDAFNNSTDEMLKFSDLLNKTFVTSGLDSNAISSTMYNLTQSLSTGRLLGQDYRIIKQNAPQIIKYLEEFYQVNRAGLDDLVSKGEVTASALKQAMFNATEDINTKFEKMPVTFAQAWTKFQNALQRALQPVAKILSKVADWLEGIVDFISENQWVLYVLGGAIAALAAEYVVMHGAAIAASIAQWGLNSAMLACPATWIILALAAVAAVLIYLWNTNDWVAEQMIGTWDNMLTFFEVVGITIKSIFYGVVQIVAAAVKLIVYQLQWMANAAVGLFNPILGALEAMGADVHPIQFTFAEQVDKDLSAVQGALDEEIRGDWSNVVSNAAERMRTREDRVKNRQKIGFEDLGSDLANYIGGVEEQLDDVIGTDSTGGSAIKTTTNDSLLSDDDIKLLLDVATRDYKLNYQQVTPQITLTFGDVRETADVDDILNKVADRLEEIYDSNLEVVST